MLLALCKAAERYCIGCGILFAGAQNLFYDGTDWTECRMFGLNL